MGQTVAAIGAVTLPLDGAAAIILELAAVTVALGVIWRTWLRPVVCWFQRVGDVITTELPRIANMMNDHEVRIQHIENYLMPPQSGGRPDGEPTPFFSKPRKPQ